MNYIIKQINKLVCFVLRVIYKSNDSKFQCYYRDSENFPADKVLKYMLSTPPNKGLKVRALFFCDGDFRERLLERYKEEIVPNQKCKLSNGILLEGKDFYKDLNLFITKGIYSSFVDGIYSRVSSTLKECILEFPQLNGDIKFIIAKILNESRDHNKKYPLSRRDYFESRTSSSLINRGLALLSKRGLLCRAVCLGEK